MSFRSSALALMAGLALSTAAGAGDVQVVDVQARAEGGGRFGFSVTLRHADTGWAHYADQWRVLAPDGTVLGVRTLAHPHVDEQPFTRSLGSVRVPAGVRSVAVDARDSRHGRAKKTFAVTLPGR